MFGLVFGAHLEPCGSAWDSDLPCWAIPVLAGPQVKNIPTVSVSLNAIGGLTSPRKPWNLIHLAVSFKDVSCACSHLVWWPMFSSLLQAPFGTNFGTTCWCQTCSHYGILWWLWQSTPRGPFMCVICARRSQPRQQNPNDGGWLTVAFNVQYCYWLEDLTAIKTHMGLSSSLNSLNKSLCRESMRV